MNESSDSSAEVSYYRGVLHSVELVDDTYYRGEILSESKFDSPLSSFSILSSTVIALRLERRGELYLLFSSPLF